MNSAAVDYLLTEGLSPLLDGLGQRAVFNSSVGEIYAAVDPENRVPFRPDAVDLATLHKTIRSRRVVTILEFGVGYSTLVMADALSKNEKDYGEYVRANLRRRDPFKLYTVDADPAFIDLTKALIPTELNDLIEFIYSPVSVSTFNGRMATFTIACQTSALILFILTRQISSFQAVMFGVSPLPIQTGCR